MSSSKMTRGLGAFSVLTLAGATVLVFHSAALAQQAEPKAKDSSKAKPEAKTDDQAKPEAKADDQAKPEAKDDAGAKQAPPLEELPPEYGPPPGYRHAPPPPPRGYPPPGYGPQYDYYYGPYGRPTYPPRYYRARPHYPPPGPRFYPEPISYRPFFFGVGLGVGGVAIFPVQGAGDNASRPGMSYNLHFGFGVSPRWSIVLAGDGAYSYFDGYGIDQSVWSIGPQVFITRHLYARGGIGVASKSIDLSSSYNYYDYYAYDTYSDSGMGWTVALGWEFMQSYHVSLGLEAAATYGHYQTEDAVTLSKNQGTLGINFMLQLF
jgi:hypothetical protein